MNRDAETQYPIHELLRTRWSPVAFADTPVDGDTIGSLLEAARWAPSSYNEQPWTLILARRDDREAFDRLAGCLVEFNQQWASRAPLLLLAVARREFTKNGKPNRHARYDVGQAIAHLTVQATASGLYVHQMAGFDPDQAREVCGIPETHDAITMMAIGYIGDPSELPPQQSERDRSPRERKPLAEVAQVGRWGDPWSAAD